jgi:hypothetical protein
MTIAWGITGCNCKKDGENVNNAGNADKVDGYDASAAPTANRLLPLDNNAKFPNSVLYMGDGSGLDADKVRGLPADFTCLKQQNGYTKLPNGLIIQWGKTSSKRVVFPIPFPHAAFVALVSRVSSDVRWHYDLAVYDLSMTGMSIRDAYDCFYYWLAIGY